MAMFPTRFANNRAAWRNPYQINEIIASGTPHCQVAQMAIMATWERELRPGILHHQQPAALRQRIAFFEVQTELAASIDSPSAE